MTNADKIKIRNMLENLVNGNALNMKEFKFRMEQLPYVCLLYTSPSPRDRTRSRMPSSA